MCLGIQFSRSGLNLTKLIIFSGISFWLQVGSLHLLKCIFFATNSAEIPGIANHLMSYPEVLHEISGRARISVSSNPIAGCVSHCLTFCMLDPGWGLVMHLARYADGSGGWLEDVVDISSRS